MELYPNDKFRDPHLERRWRIDCDLAYDGGGSEWSQGYRTKIGAKIAAFLHYHVFSWGGSIKLVDQGKRGHDTSRSRD